MVSMVIMAGILIKFISSSKWNHHLSTRANVQNDGDGGGHQQHDLDERISLKIQRKQHLHPNEHDDDNDDKNKNPHPHLHQHHHHNYHQNNGGGSNGGILSFIGRHISSATPNNSDWPNTMKNITVTVGRDATFECVFPKLKDFRLVWFHQDHHVLLATHDTVISKNGRISVRSHANTTFYLTIHDVQEKDRGFYMCQVNTKPMRIQIGYLEVNVPPSFIEEKTSSDFDIAENSSATLNCLAKGRPEPQIVWRREDEQPIQLDSQTNESSLTIKGQYLNLKNVSRHQMGAYLCIASNGILPTISKRIFLGVSFKPVIRTNKRLVEAAISSSPILECHIESYPRANVYWQKNNQLPLIVYSDRKYTLSMNESIIPYRFIARLKISDIQKNDFDKYNCIGKNKMGNERNFIQLLERKRPPPPPSTKKPLRRPITMTTTASNLKKHNQKL
uniref:Lachesin-like n=1 Tax=Dermatophagoides pteronyssinus TaxID=6956 RepID=A0A6P6Y241_DERPT